MRYLKGTLPLAALCFAASLSLNVLAQTATSDTASGAAVDNTKINQRDKDADTTTPTDQPNNKADIQVAAEVRNTIVKDKSLSTLGHNVKLVASNGTVTLRGPVANAEEKSKIAQLAASVHGVTQVDNQLDIKR